MVIALYANLKAFYPCNPYNYFIKSLINSLATVYPENDFYLILPGSITEFKDRAENLSIIPLKLVKAPFSNFLFRKKIARTIKKLSPHSLLSFDTIIKSPVPQTVVIEDIGSKNFGLVGLKNLNAFFCLSQTVKAEFINQNKIDPGKIHVVYGGPVKSMQRVAEEAKDVTKEKYTNGKEYFLYRGAIQKELNIITLLKAFSIFKKRQKSSMKLVLMGKLVWDEKEFSKLIDTYKYKEEVVLLTEADELAKGQLITAAFAFIQPYRSNSLSFAWDAVQNEIPVLINKDSPFMEAALDAALYFDASRSDDMADKLMLIYKDEKLREQLIEKGKQITLNNPLGETIKLISQNLQLTGN